MNAWDIALVGVVSVMGTAVAYVRHPERKALVLMFPVPFTLATLALGRPVDATNVLGLGLLFGFSVGVWILRVRLRWPILVAIVTCAVGYCLIGAAIARLDLAGDAAFWAMAAAMLVAALMLVRVLPYRSEPHHRTPLPVWIKLPAIALIIAVIVVIKKHLGGFMTTFPMVGVVAAYESRHSLWTIVRRIPWIMLTLTPFMAIVRLAQKHHDLPVALAIAWPFFLVLLWVLRKRFGGGQTERESVHDNG